MLLYQYATSEFSRFSNLVPKERRDNEVKCGVAFVGLMNDVPW